MAHNRQAQKSLLSTIPAHPITMLYQVNHPTPNNFHTPYYYCCYLFIYLPLEERSWGRTRPAAENRTRRPLSARPNSFQDGHERSTVHLTAMLGSRGRGNEGTLWTWQPRWLTPT